VSDVLHILAITAALTIATLAVAGLVVVMVLSILRSFGDDSDGDDGTDGGGGGLHRDRHPPPEHPSAGGEEPAWWPEFERELDEYIGARGNRRA
jgi:hypothetical protein